MNAFIVVAIAAMMIFLSGCDSSTSSHHSYVPPQPVVPVQPVEPEKPDYELPDQDEIPTAGIGSIKSDMDCNGGTITTNYSFGNVSDDSRSFVMQYERNGVLEDLTYPSTSTTGSRTTVKDIYYARQNDDKRDAMWIVTISYQGADETYNLVTTTLRQPKCDDNTTSISSVLEFK